jgi:hypothetical protein
MSTIGQLLSGSALELLSGSAVEPRLLAVQAQED